MEGRAGTPEAQRRASTVLGSWRLFGLSLLFSSGSLLVIVLLVVVGGRGRLRPPDSAPGQIGAAASLGAVSGDSSVSEVLSSRAVPGADMGQALASVEVDGVRAGLYGYAAAVRPPMAATPEPPSEGEPVSITQPAAVGSCPEAAMDAFAAELLAGVNDERRSRGLAALALSGCLTFVAQLHSNDMAARGYFSHVTPEGETAFSLLGRYGVAYGTAGENLAQNDYPDDQAVAVALRDLMASPGHRANILGPYTQIGVASALDASGMRYYAMVFISPS